MATELTTRDRVLAYVRSCPYSPTYQEIASAVGLASRSTVQKHLARLELDGLVGRYHGRVYAINNKETP